MIMTVERVALLYSTYSLYISTPTPVIESENQSVAS